MLMGIDLVLMRAKYESRLAGCWRGNFPEPMTDWFSAMRDLKSDADQYLRGLILIHIPSLESRPICSAAVVGLYLLMQSIHVKPVSWLRWQSVITVQ
jgi:hypothetical protein